MIIPSLLSEDLTRIDNFKDVTGMVTEHREILFPTDVMFNGIRGYFGRGDEETHVHYENRPTYEVIARRLCEDLRYTGNPEGGREWRLPQEIEPIDIDADLPTANLLCWMPVRRPSHEEAEGLIACGINVNEFDNVFPSQYCFCYNNDQMAYVDRRLNEQSGKLKCILRLSKVLHGSMSQQDYVRMLPGHNLTPARTD
ncbi:hypothetical protein AVEN_264336-1 [Araneus ventricosus]|uniref:Uncharacterized protein n=1 Tax=Araneus ventricosus TaxID=182803 RepID=A0A4Y2H3W8_ARAVE|nr:hypothetical protein AVEN_264336-1 [Araneus ventricosus]